MNILNVGTGVVIFLLKDCLRYLLATYQRAKWKSRGVNVGRGAAINVQHGCELNLERGVNIGPGSLIIVSDERSSGALSKSKLTIGKNTTLNEYCNVRAAGGSISIGKDCLLAQMITLVGSNHSTDLGAPIWTQVWSMRNNSVVVGDDVWIGAHAVILPGSKIGNGAIIAAGAVVRGIVPDGEIWGGVPARKISVRK